MDLEHISGLIAWLYKHDKELATKLREDSRGSWCWNEVLIWLEGVDVPDELYEKFVQALIKTETARYLYRYQFFCGHRDDVLQALIETKDAYWLYRYQRDCGHRDDVLQALIETKNAAWLYLHQRDCGHRDDVVQALIEAESENTHPSDDSITPAASTCRLR